MSISTYTEFQNQSSSEKIGLVILEASQRLVGWEVYSGSVYSLAFDYQVITSIQDSGVALTAVSSVAAVVAGTYYLDRTNALLYLRTSDSVNPNGKFMGCTFKLFFANVPVAAPHDLSTGFDVEWQPYYKGDSGFNVALDNSNLLGFALEGDGTLNFCNTNDYWSAIFDKLYFDNQRVLVYSWNRGIQITEAKLLFKGRVQGKTYEPGKKVSFKVKDLLNELRSPVPVTDLSEASGAKIPPSAEKYKQRILYGFVKGTVPQNIDQELELTGYPLSGTAGVTNASKNLAGTSTTFLNDLSSGDQLLFGNDTTWYTVDAVSSDTAATLTEEYSGTTATGLAIRIKSSHAKRYMNRVHLIAGHAIKEPTTTVTLGVSLQKIDVADATDFLAGDSVLINSEIMIIDHVSGSRITFTGAMATLPSVGTTVLHLPITNVYLNSRLLTYSRDYTYDCATARITLDDLAEFNVAPIKPITGTISFNSASLTVTGTNTLFQSELKPGDWIRRQGQSTWVEVFHIVSDTSAVVRTLPAYTSAGASDRKQPEVYNSDVTLSLDCLGATENGVKTGTFIKTAAQMVSDILTRIGLDDLINSASFTVAAADCAYQLSVAIPESASDTQSKSARDYINKINQSVLGSLYQNEDFQLEYAILSPKKPAGLLALAERDVLSLSITSDSSKIVKTSLVRYLNKEFDPSSLAKSFAETSKTSDAAQYLAVTNKEQTTETYLVSETHARFMANRYAFIQELASSIVKIKTKLQAARSAVNDKLDLTHEKLYDRLGVPSSKRKIAGIQSIEKTIGGTSLEIHDLSNAFNRVACITSADAVGFDSATENERIYNGYITDSYGMQGNDPETFGSNVIW